MVVVVCSDEGFDLRSLGDLLLAHFLSDNSGVSVDTCH